jgi:hypothetical protein
VFFFFYNIAYFFTQTSRFIALIPVTGIKGSCHSTKDSDLGNRICWKESGLFKASPEEHRGASFSPQAFILGGLVA